MNAQHDFSVLAVCALTMVLCAGCVAAASPPAGKSTSTPAARVSTPTRIPTQPSPFPRFGEPQLVVSLPRTGGEEGYPYPADLNGDGQLDILVLSYTFQTQNTYPVEILTNQGGQRFSRATPEIFEGSVPLVQNPRQVVVADFNQDGSDDFFVADHGYDVSPHPGFQNTLVLSRPGGKLLDATSRLPQQSDFTHSACAADVDADGDVDLYVGNIWGQNEIDPIMLLNNGGGKFSVSRRALPKMLNLPQNGYTTCEFLDVNNDGAPDLILGDAGDDLPHEYSTPDSEILLNNGSGRFTLLPDAMPAKKYARSDIAHDITPADLNGDIYPDLFIVYERQPELGSYIQALVNKGDGTFWDQTDRIMDPMPRQVWVDRMEMRDIDHDGDLDLLAMPWDWRDPDPILFINDGEGFYEYQSSDFEFPFLYFNFLFSDAEGRHDIIFLAQDVFIMRPR